MNLLVKNNIFKFILFIFLSFSILGVNSKIYNFLIYSQIKNSSQEIIKTSYEKSKTLFLSLSLLKGITDVIEGSELSFSFGIGLSVEAGDIVKPLYDFIDIVWKISLLSLLSLKTQEIFFLFFKLKFLDFLIFFSILNFIIFKYINFRFNFIFKKSSYLALLVKFNFIFKKLSYFSLFLGIIIYFIFPLGIISLSILNNYLDTQYSKKAEINIKNEEENLKKLKIDVLAIINELKSSPKDLFFKENRDNRFKNINLKLNKINENIKNISESISDNLVILLITNVLNIILFPIIFIFFTWKIFKIFSEKILNLS